MLKHLHIRNLAIIDELDLDFNGGMTVLTGETGAGKSILIDALGLILGDRGETNLIREGYDKAEISANFDVRDRTEIQSLLSEQSISCDEDELIVRRVISRDGRSKAYINSSPVPVQLLRSIGSFLIDIHGQHAHQSLMSRTVQRTTLDFFGDHSELLGKVEKIYLEWKSICEKLSDAGSDPEKHASAIELLQYQVKELEETRPVKDEYDELEEEFRKLSNVNELISTTSNVLQMLSENEMSADSSLQRSIHDLRELHKADPGIEKLSSLLESASIQLSDAIDEVRHYAESLDINPERLDEVDKRLNSLIDISRKHHVHARELPEHFEQLQERLDHLINSRDSVEELMEKKVKLLEDYKTHAKILHDARLKSAGKMASEISGQLKQLGMPDGEFLIELTRLDDNQPHADGLDQVEFQVSLNPGSSPQAMRKVASGGELSRISLAVQMISPGAKQIPTLIFDEIDAGIGGRTADIVGGLLKKLARKQQVFCVTHLPQVASRADNHLQVSKFSRNNLTFTRVGLLDNNARVDEIARMLGGMRVSDKSRDHARELLGLESMTSGD